MKIGSFLIKIVVYQVIVRAELDFETQNEMADKGSQVNRNKKEIDQLKVEIKKKDNIIGDMKLKSSIHLEELKNRKKDVEKNLRDILKKNDQIQNLEKEIEALKIKVEETSKEFKRILEESKQIKKERDNLCKFLLKYF